MEAAPQPFLQTNDIGLLLLFVLASIAPCIALLHEELHAVTIADDIETEGSENLGGDSEH